uniref:Elongator complex protein 4 n=1 Tax=Accipiter nisus TaxID=211598 RepID=A0A8B9N355_9AVES
MQLGTVRVEFCVKNSHYRMSTGEPKLSSKYYNVVLLEAYTSAEWEKPLRLLSILLFSQASPTTSTKFGHYYDVSKTMSPELFQSIKWHSFYLPEELSLHPLPLHLPCKLTPTRQLLQSIQRIIYQEGFDGSDPQKKLKNILRIGIQSLGSMLWGDDICSSDTPEHIHSLTKFLYVLRGLLRKSLSACIITVPAHLIQNKAIMERVTNLSDMVVGLESFIGSERETNPLYKDYHGLVHVQQIPRLNSLICDVSDTKDLAFRLKRKLFTIEVRETVLGILINHFLCITEITFRSFMSF